MSDAGDADRLARVVLSRAVEPGDLTTASLVGQVGPQQAVRAQLEPRERSGLPDRLRSVDPVRELDQAARCGIRFVVPDDDEWPLRFDELDHGIEVQGMGGVPPGLWVKGPLMLTALAKSVAMVGSRAATDYGTYVTGEMAATIARAGVPVVSGGAIGIDVAAHVAAIASGGASVAVLACGLDRIYPQENARLLAHLGAEYALVSEQPPGSSPTRVRFLARNRLIAALTSGTVLVEAALRSGALNTAGWAEQLNRPVMCVPGPVTSHASQGVHHWMRRGGATLVTHGQEVLEMIGAAGEHLLEEPRGEERPRDRLARKDRLVLEAVPSVSAAGVLTITQATTLHVRDVDPALRRLERAGFVRQVEKGWRLAGAQ